jgi:hypothetical protein
MDRDPSRNGSTQNTNAKQGKESAEQLYEDDGRVTYENSKEHKGDWGRHPKDEKESDRGNRNNGKST